MKTSSWCNGPLSRFIDLFVRDDDARKMIAFKLASLLIKILSTVITKQPFRINLKNKDVLLQSTPGTCQLI